MPPASKLVPKLVSVEGLLAGRCGEIAVGDVLAFNGVSRVDEFIQGATCAQISHVAVVMRAQADGPLLILEATGLGVTLTPLADALAAYQEDHTCFYLPLDAQSRARVDPEALVHYYAANAFDQYNYDGVIEAGVYERDHPLYEKFMRFFHGRSLRARLGRWWSRAIGRTGHIWAQVLSHEPRCRRLFCSQLVTEVLQAVKVVPRPPKAGLVVPVEVCWFDIYAAAYQLNGKELTDPFSWGGQAQAKTKEKAKAKERNGP